MNKKSFFHRILAIFLVTVLLTSCGKNGNVYETTDTSSSQTQPPTVSVQDFTGRLQNAILNETQSETDIEITERHQYDPSSSMTKQIFAKWTSDLSDPENPRFLYSSKRAPESTEPDVLFFYDDGYFYLKDRETQYRQPASLPQTVERNPFNALSAIFGNQIPTAFTDAAVTEHTDGSVTATVQIAPEDHVEAVVAYFYNFGIEASGIAYKTDEKASPLTVSVTLRSDGTILSYRVEAVMQARLQDRIYPVTYTVTAECAPIDESFSVTLPEAEVREKYPEAEPEIDRITAEEFWKRFEKSEQKSNTVYTEMVTNATASYEFSNGVLVTVPLLNVTKLDLADPKAPKIAIEESVLSASGILQKTEIYYKDDVYYCSANGYRFSVPYPAEEYLANVEASSKEKEEAGISSIFLTEDMLARAEFTVGSDQSVSAFIQFDGKTQEKNIFYNVNSLYGDDLSEMQGVEFLETAVRVTLDRFNYLRTYSLTVTVSAESEGKPVIMAYSVEYRYEYDEEPREIDFPDDLGTWDSSESVI